MDNIKGMRQLIPDNSIDLTVTSPPYDNLRDYEQYDFNFKDLAKELYRVTKDGGVIVWIVGDATIDGSETGTSFKQALYFKEIGFNLHDTMIYQKNGGLPLNNKRYEPRFEYMFILSKNKPKTFNPIKIKSKRAGKIKKSTYRQKDGTIKKAWNYGKPVKNKKVKGNVWLTEVGYMKTTKDKIAFKHPAMFPEKLAEDHIKSWSNENDVILDPFMGSGTTAKMAKKLNRKYVGFEISSKYCEIIKERLASIDE
jgi:site-specific DNA-methyltransferase (adenine-specific)